MLGKMSRIWGMATLQALQDSDIYAGKTTVQKLLYFALPADERRVFYKPYHYGPYSEAVQSAFGSLANNEYIVREKTGQYRLATGEEHIGRYQDDPVVRRLRAASRFLAKKNCTGTQSISILAKVHLLKQGRDLSESELRDFIRQRGQYFGWKELTQEALNSDQLQTYIDLADELEAAFPNV